MPRMTFGKYNNVDMADVPLSYLTWVLEQEWSRKKPNTCKNIKNEVAERLGIEPVFIRVPSARTLRVEVPMTVPAHIKDAVKAVVNSGFRVVAMTAHPDQGGSNGEMRTIIEAKDWLLRALSR